MTVTTSNCQIDHSGSTPSEQRSGSQICDTCIESARTHLKALPWLAAQFLSPPQRTFPTGSMPRRTERRATPIRLSALEFRLNAGSILDSWVGLIVEERAGAQHPGQGIEATCQFLHDAMPWLATHPSVADFVSEICTLIEQAVELLHPDGEAIPLARSCGEYGCEGRLSVEIRPTAPGAVIRCERGHDWVLADWLCDTQFAGAAAKRVTLPTKLAAQSFSLKEATIRQWARRGKLTRYGPPGRAEYDIRELAEIIADTASTTS